jgi:hypothetical protein
MRRVDKSYPMLVLVDALRECCGASGSMEHQKAMPIEAPPQGMKLGVLYTPRLSIPDGTQDAFEEVSGGKDYGAFVKLTVLDFLTHGTAFLHVEQIDSSFELGPRCELADKERVCFDFPKDLDGLLRNTGIRFVLVIGGFSSRAGYAPRLEDKRVEEGIPLRSLMLSRGQVPTHAHSQRHYARSALYTIYNSFRFAVYDTQQRAFVTIGFVRNEDKAGDVTVDDWRHCLYRCLDEVTAETPFRVDFNW